MNSCLDKITKISYHLPSIKSWKHKMLTFDKENYLDKNKIARQTPHFQQHKHDLMVVTIDSLFDAQCSQ